MSDKQNRNDEYAEYPDEKKKQKDDKNVEDEEYPDLEPDSIEQQRPAEEKGGFMDTFNSQENGQPNGETLLSTDVAPERNMMESAGLNMQMVGGAAISGNAMQSLAAFNNRMADNDLEEKAQQNEEEPMQELTREALQSFIAQAREVTRSWPNFEPISENYPFVKSTALVINEDALDGLNPMFMIVNTINDSWDGVDAAIDQEDPNRIHVRATVDHICAQIMIKAFRINHNGLDRQFDVQQGNIILAIEKGWKATSFIFAPFVTRLAWFCEEEGISLGFVDNSQVYEPASLQTSLFRGGKWGISLKYDEDRDYLQGVEDVLDAKVSEETDEQQDNASVRPDDVRDTMSQLTRAVSGKRTDVATDNLRILVTKPNHLISSLVIKQIATSSDAQVMVNGVTFLKLMFKYLAEIQVARNNRQLKPIEKKYLREALAFAKYINELQVEKNHVVWHLSQISRVWSPKLSNENSMVPGFKKLEDETFECLEQYTRMISKHQDALDGDDGFAFLAKPLESLKADYQKHGLDIATEWPGF